MGYIEKVNDDDHADDFLKQLPFIYNVCESVGHYGVNRASDVKMVQYLLNIVKGELDLGKDDLKVDGLCGSMTTGRIRRFQRMLNEIAPNEIKVDGRFDTVKGHSVFTPSHRCRYSLIYLNGHARTLDNNAYRQLQYAIYLDDRSGLDEMVDFYLDQRVVSKGLLRVNW